MLLTGSHHTEPDAFSTFPVRAVVVAKGVSPRIGVIAYSLHALGEAIFILQAAHNQIGPASARGRQPGQSSLLTSSYCVQRPMSSEVGFEWVSSVYLYKRRR